MITHSERHARPFCRQKNMFSAMVHVRLGRMASYLLSFVVLARFPRLGLSTSARLASGVTRELVAGVPGLPRLPWVFCGDPRSAI